jgi:hypothetical protein
LPPIDDEVREEKPEQPAEPEPIAWYDTNVVFICRKELAKRRDNAGIPDTMLVVKVLDAFDCRESYDAWIADISRRLRPETVRSWGLFPADAKSFMERHQEGKAERLRSEQEAKAEEQPRT